MKRFFTAVITMALCVCLVACGSSKSVDAVSVGEKVMKEASGFPEMKTITSKDKNADINFSTLCDFDYSKVGSFYYAYAADGTAPEVAVVSVKNTDDTADLMSSIKAHAKTREGTMQEYTPDQVAMVQSYILVQENGTVGFFIGKGAAALEKSFKAEVK